MEEKNVVNFYCLCNKLKDLVRTGWKVWNVKRERVESVAEHIFGVQMLAISMWSEFNYKDIDIKKVIMMIAVHELEEITIGDITRFDKEYSSKNEAGHKAIKELLSALNSHEYIENLIFEFDEGKTKDAIFAKNCDKLECDLQCKIYDEENCVDIFNQQSNVIAGEREVKELIDKHQSWSGAWLEFGRNKYLYDENFKNVSTYASKNKISK